MRALTHCDPARGWDDMAEGHRRRGPDVRALIGGALVLGLAAVGGGVASATAPKAYEKALEGIERGTSGD